MTSADEGSCKSGGYGLPGLTVVPSAAWAGSEFLIPSWDEETYACWGITTDTIYVFNDENIAMSPDSGKSWRWNPEPLWNAPFCGINNGLLWLKYGAMSVFSFSQRRKLICRLTQREHSVPRIQRSWRLCGG